MTDESSAQGGWGHQQALQLASDPVAPAGRVAKQNLARSRVELEHTNSDTGGLLQSRLLGAHSVNRRSRRPAAATAFMAGLSNTSTDRGRQNTRRQSMSRAETSASYRSRYSADFNSSIASEGNTPTITNNQQKRNNRIGMKGQLHAESRPSANLPSTSSDSAPFVPFHLLPLNLRPGAELKDNRVGYEEGRRKPGPTGQGLGMVKKQKGKERGSGVQGSSLASERTSELLGKNSPTKDEIDTVVTV
ncbi:unnamed protein product [Protopolystoma xenopodis]|uniref:Uncharacterized protein n=1 Tax=Protopolystoma xenopodis TaxID=117903 RepID=A0A3S5A251_9PLAT|nr:unnamed protein product [Protopolystoma xenopodis]